MSRQRRPSYMAGYHRAGSVRRKQSIRPTHMQNVSPASVLKALGVLFLALFGLHIFLFFLPFIIFGWADKFFKGCDKITDP